MPFGSSQWMYNSGDNFYNGVATQSLRLNGVAENTTLYRDLTATGNRRTATISFWMKNDRSDAVQYYWSKGDGGGVQTSFQLFTHSDSTFSVYAYNSDSQILNLRTNRVFRDVSAWYHFVVAVDTNQATASDRVKLYINGVEETSFSTASYMAQNTDTVLGLFSSHKRERLGDYQATYLPNTATGGSAGNRVNGYFSDFYYIDGLSFFSDTSGTPNTSFNINSFGETKNGVWIPKAYTGSYGTNGYRLEFKQTGTGTASSSTIGADTSGNDNHWTTSNVSAEDSNIPDSPENNWSTMNSLINGYGTNITMSEGNLAGTGTSGQYNNTLGTILMTSGKWYWEISSADFNNYDMLGIAIETAIQTTDSTPYGQTGVIAYATQGAVYNESASGTGSYTSFQASEIIGIAVDLDASPRTFKFYNNNTLQGTINLSSNFDDIGILPFFCIGNTDTIKVNFGQDSSFAGLKTAQGNTDDNDLGDFYYQVPDGYLALCSANLPEPTISPNADTQADDYFTPRLYISDNIGAGGTQSVTGVGFQPDWVWIKNRSSASTSHTLFDSVRTAGKMLQSDSTSLEASNSEYGYLSSFDSDGFTLTGGTTNANFINQGTDAYVSWNWKAGGTASSYTPTGATASVSMTRNSTAGFSIVTYTGTGTANDVGDQALGHGLQVNDVDTKPDMMIIKSRSSDYAGTWKVWHKDMGGTLTTDFLTLNTTSGTASTSDKVWDGAEPTSTLFSVGYDWDVNKNTATYVGYFFASVAGYSRFGSYTGNGSTDGTFVYLGFRPSFIMYKRTNTTGNWLMDDNKTSTYNYDSNYLLANSADQEGDTTTNSAGHMFDHLSNGFKMRNTNSERNGSGSTFIYMAFAENPFKYANAR